MNKTPRILFDLWVPMSGGYAGIPQDARTIFHLLSESENVDVSGLVYLSGARYPFRKPFANNHVGMKFDPILENQNYTFSTKGKPLIKKIIDRFFRMRGMGRFSEVYNLLAKHRFGLKLVSQDHYEFIWNQVFSKTLDEKIKESVLKSPFFYSDLSFRDLQLYAHYGYQKYINTEGFDFVVFPDVRAVNVSPNTKKIIRYHDSFGFLCPDFFQMNHSQFNLNSLKACAKDSYFVCNSEHTRDDLITVFPELESKAFIVPPLVKPYPKMLDWDRLKDICLRRFSNKVYKRADKRLIESIFTKEPQFDYILSLSTLEPRKNYSNLIKAWEKFNKDNNQKTKLIIVANKGWLSEEIEKIMLPHIEQGEIIHLAGVPSEEIPYLFSHAKCFAYLSFIEGFGSPPLEGMQCECPVLASDNPTHRWTMGDAALYVDPYDVDDIAEGMKQLLSVTGSEVLRTSLAKKGLEQVQKYSPEVIKEKWSDLFARLA